MKRLNADVDPATANVYASALQAIHSAKVPFLVGGGLAFTYYTGYPRDFHDLDLFCKAGDYPKILEILEKKDFTVSIPDEKWLAKAMAAGGAQIDFLFSSPNGVQTVDDSWLKNSRTTELFGEHVNILGPEQLLWGKIYVQNSDRFDGPDVYHLILKTGNTLDWRSVLEHMEADWEVLLAALTTFRFIFPSKRDLVPEWLMTELLDRAERQLDMPTPHDRICRGPLLSRTDYLVDIHEGGFIV